MSVLPGSETSFLLPEAYFHEGPWTEEDYFALPEDNARIELLDGGLFVNPPPTSRHQRLCGRLRSALERACPDGLEVLLGVGVRVDAGRILIPDVAVVRFSDREVKAFDPCDVLLVIEVVSPGSVVTDRAIKPMLYAEAGLAVYVRLEQSGPNAHVHRLQGGRYVLESAGSTLVLDHPFRAEVDLPSLLDQDWRG